MAKFYKRSGLLSRVFSFFCPGSCIFFQLQLPEEFCFYGLDVNARSSILLGHVNEQQPRPTTTAGLSLGRPSFLSIRPRGWNKKIKFSTQNLETVGLERLDRYLAKQISENRLRPEAAAGRSDKKISVGASRCPSRKRTFPLQADGGG